MLEARVLGRRNLMLYEDDVKRAVASHLRKNGFTNLKVARLQEHGPDIIALMPGGKKELWLEAKGETSSDSRTRRHGLPFDSKQRTDHLGKALLKCAQWGSRSRRVVTGIAFPIKGHAELIEGVMPALRRLRITVFLVHEGGEVDVPLGLPERP